MFKKFCVISFLICSTFAALYASTWDRETVFHMRKDGTAYIELDGHYYEVKNLGHSEDCPCLRD